MLANHYLGSNGKIRAGGSWNGLQKINGPTKSYRLGIQITNMKKLIKNGRKRIENDLRDTVNWQFFSPIFFLQFSKTLPIIQKNVSGNLIDLGCGTMPLRKYILPFVETYEGLDLFPKSDEIRFISDIQNMRVVENTTYNAAICLEVLEHVPDPFKAVREVYRILRIGGKVIITVPHLSRLHDEPYDYYRYTCYGINVLLSQAGFQEIRVYPRGGIFSFLGHQISTIFLSVFWPVPLVKYLAFWLNKWLITRFCVWLDSKLDKKGVFALGYIAVAQKL